MKMSIGEKKILFVFGCPNREATMDRLYQVADLIPDPAGKKVVEALADKLDSEGVEKWYRCFFYNMKLEMEAYYRHKAILTKIEKETIILFNEGESTASIYTYNVGLKKRLAAFSKKYPDLCCLEKPEHLGGVSYLIDKSRLSIRLQPPYSEERRQKASQYARQNGFNGKTK